MRRTSPVTYWITTATAIVLILSGLEARAQTVSWNTGSGFWNVAANWTPAVVPPAGTIARIVNNDAVNRTVTFNFNYTTPLTEVILSQNGAGTNTLTIGANQLLSGAMSIGDGGRGAVNHLAGTVGVGTLLQLGTGTTSAAGTSTFPAPARTSKKPLTPDDWSALASVRDEPAVALLPAAGALFLHRRRRWGV